MAPQDDAALEAEEEVLADRLDRLERPAVQPLRKSLQRRAGVGRLDLEPLADERLEPARRSVKRIALRHAPERSLRRSCLPRTDEPEPRTRERSPHLSG